MANEALKLVEALPTPSHKADSLIPLTLTQRLLNGDPTSLGRVYMLLAALEATVGRNTDALNHLKIALDIYEKYDIQREIGIICSNMGDIYLRTSDYDQARTALSNIGYYCRNWVIYLVCQLH